jgi:virginiamycin B lyase
MNRFRRQMVATAAALGVAAIAAASASAAPTATTIPLPTDSKTEGITRGPDGALWFANFGTHSIGRVTSGLAGSFPLPNPGPPVMSGPFDITVGPDNNLWFTAFNGTIGKLIPGLGITGYQAVPSPTANLKGIAPGAGSTLWYLEAEGDMLRSITTAGDPGAAINLGAPPGLNLGAPDGITAGPAGDTNVYFTTDAGWIGKKDTNSGSPVTAASLGGVDANGITVGPDGNLWVTSASGVAKVSPGGGGAPSVIQSFATQGSNPRGITTGPDNALWFTESGTNSVGRVTLDGQVSSIPLSGCALPDDIATASDGSLWVTCFGSATLARITESGATPPALTPPGGGGGRGAVPIAGLKASFTVKKTVIAGKLFTVKVTFNKPVTKVQVRVQIRNSNTKLKGAFKKFKTIKSKLVTGTKAGIPVKIAKPGVYKLRLSYKNGPRSVNTNAVKVKVLPKRR